ncbi:hypothetical protein PUNSTDRAFT_68326, partial [Punctularia strigosozonata HHB-11173 SS5]|uniref:uncharacterized protein n=1 Tax=Punctularia strigosozonata (strain HHB-11173) TaxID=741275 RepID=UPI0004418213
DANGYFANKTLSRKHAEVWAEDDKIYVKDTKSQNGTYINGKRLSDQGMESVACEICPNDILEFGTDVFWNNGTTPVHTKVYARVIMPNAEIQPQAKL